MPIVAAVGFVGLPIEHVDDGEEVHEEVFVGLIVADVLPDFVEFGVAASLGLRAFVAEPVECLHTAFIFI